VVHPQLSSDSHKPGANELIAIVKAVARQDQTAMTRLYDATSRLVYGLVLRILGDPSAAEEVLVDVYMQAWRQASRYSEDRGSASHSSRVYPTTPNFTVVMTFFTVRRT